MGPVAYSTVGFRDRSLEEALQTIAEAGFRQVEITALAPHFTRAPDANRVSTIRSMLAGCGFSGVTLHAPMGDNVLGAPEEAVRAAAVAVFEAYLQVAAKLAASTLVIHTVPNPGFVKDAAAIGLPESIRDSVLRSLDELVPIAEREGVCILLENLPYHCDFPFLDMGELRPLVDGYPAAALGLVVDTGHAATRKCDPAKEIRIAGSRLGGTHLQDVNGTDPQDNHWPPTHGDLDWTAICAALIESEYVGPWTFEVSNARHNETPDELVVACRAIAKAWACTSCPI